MIPDEEMDGAKGDQLARLGERVANCLRQAEEHEAKAADLRQKAEEYRRRFNELAESRVQAAQKNARRRTRRPRARSERPEASPGYLGVTEAIRTWAKGNAKPFRLIDVQTVMRQVNPKVTDGPFYHLVRRGEIKKLHRGLFVHPDHYEAAMKVEGQGEGPADQATTH